MTSPRLDKIIARALQYGDLPEEWRVPALYRFSPAKALYDYQTDALKNAARALYLYYTAYLPARDNEYRNLNFAALYGPDDDALPYDVRKHEGRTDAVNPLFRILSRYMKEENKSWRIGPVIPYHNMINRMGFWMATGSGKTLIMMKMIQHLHALQKHGLIPGHNMLILAPGDELLAQIRATADEFNQNPAAPRINLIPLRDFHRARQGALDDAVNVYYYRSDLVWDEDKEKKLDYRRYENGGKWYVFLDEAHKGDKDDSKRQAYYSVFAREGFMFNFSATFTGDADIVTTVKKYNLEEFIKNGYGKNILLNQSSFAAFRRGADDASAKYAIVLKSFITLAFVSRRVKELREKAGDDNLYHLPLMLTLANTVNAGRDNNVSDLQAFFKVLREIAANDISAAVFKQAKEELAAEWRDTPFFFAKEEDKKARLQKDDIKAMQSLEIADLRAAVFHTTKKSALQCVQAKGGGKEKEIALQMKGADTPFALIKIGDTKGLINGILAGYERDERLGDKSFFSALNKSRITVLMGSRAFFESWDSDRPNVINFINIGGAAAKIFAVQSIGRGVRIAPAEGWRGRLAFLSPPPSALAKRAGEVTPAETLFVYATKPEALKTVLEGLTESGGGDGFEAVDGIEPAPVAKIAGGKGENMPLLKPVYKEEGVIAAPFSMSEETLARFSAYLNTISDSVLIVRDGLLPAQINAMRKAMSKPEKHIKIDSGKNYASLPFLQGRFLSHLEKKQKAGDKVAPIDAGDIVHFRHVRAHRADAARISKRIKQVKAGEMSEEKEAHLFRLRKEGKISKADLAAMLTGMEEAVYEKPGGSDLLIRKIARHYYVPVVLGDEKADYIRHIIKVGSEIAFLRALEKRVKADAPAWDAWMFSKLDESRDKLHIPYFDGSRNDYRNFHPDFVFWMCRQKERQYNIVFVDPKGTAHAAAQSKIDGYEALFVEKNAPRVFSHGRWKVTVNLLFYNPKIESIGKKYRRYWTDNPSAIFAAAPRRGE